MDILPDIPQTRQVDQKNCRRRVCVIGAGPAGLAALKIFSESGETDEGWDLTAFEARHDVGGVWLPSPPGAADPPLTPLYDSLTTNLPHPVMAFPSLSFPPETPLFPRAEAVASYLRSYADHFELMKYIRLEATVSCARWEGEGEEGVWKVTVEYASSSGTEMKSKHEQEFDFLVIANGHYRKPRYANTKGVDAWRALGKATHSAWYRSPEEYLGENNQKKEDEKEKKVVIVIGAGPSGSDITADMLGASHIKTVIHSVTGGINEDTVIDEGGGPVVLKRRGRVASYGSPEDGRVVFEDGTIEVGVEHCILATGYEYSFPFLTPPVLRTSLPPPCPPLPRDLYNSTYNVFPLARHLLPLPSQAQAGRIAFLGLLVRVVPFPLVEVQARAAISVFRDPARLDGNGEAIDVMERYEALRAEFSGDGWAIAKGWHRFREQEQFEYRDALSAFAGDTWRVREWEKEMYGKKDLLRKEWRELERLGEASEWVKGVGEGDSEWEEWIELMRRVIKRAEDREAGKSRL